MYFLRIKGTGVFTRPHTEVTMSVDAIRASQPVSVQSQKLELKPKEKAPESQTEEKQAASKDSSLEEERGSRKLVEA
jgi:hypothetical protein